MFNYSRINDLSSTPHNPGAISRFGLEVLQQLIQISVTQPENFRRSPDFSGDPFLAPRLPQYIDVQRNKLQASPRMRQCYLKKGTKGTINYKSEIFLGAYAPKQ